MSQPTALGANIFAGLFTVGVKQAGFKVLGHLEHGPYGVATAKLNFPDIDIRVGREHWKEEDFKKKVNFMFCNPPCAAWSNAASKGGANQIRGAWDTQVDRLRYVYDCAEAGIRIRPDAWCWESVSQAFEADRPFVTQIAEMWNDAGWHTTVLLQNNLYLGAPQHRVRMFLIAHRHPLAWPSLMPKQTVREVLKKMKKATEKPYEIPKMTPHYARLWKLSANHGGYLRKTFEVEGRGGLEGGTPSVLYKRLDLDKPAPVMLSSLKRCHPTEPRYLNWSEWLALCGVPHTFKTSVRAAEAATQELARAVLPPVGRWLATAVREGLKKPALKGRPTCTLVDLRDPDFPRQQKLWDFDGLTIKPIVPPPLPPLNAPKPPKPCVDCGGDPKKAKKCQTCAGTGLRPPKVTQRKPCKVCEGKKVLAKKPCAACNGTGLRLPRDRSKPGSGERIREMLMKGMGAQAILEVIHEEFPQSRATGSDVSWNKMKLRKMGKVIPGDGGRAPRVVTGGPKAPKMPRPAVPAENAVVFGKAAW